MTEKVLLLRCVDCKVEVVVREGSQIPALCKCGAPLRYLREFEIPKRGSNPDRRDALLGRGEYG